MFKLISGQCEVCLLPAAEYVANKIIKESLTQEQAARECNVSLSDWVVHYELHVRNKIVNAIATDIEPLKDSLVDKIKEAQGSVTRVLNLSKSIYDKLMIVENQENTKLISAYAMLEKNSMLSLEKLAVLEGDISQATTINIHNNTLKIDAVMGIILEDAPPELQTKILNKLKKLS